MQYQTPIVVSIEILDDDRLISFCKQNRDLKDATLAIANKVASVEEAKKLCKSSKKPVVVYYQKQGPPRFGVINHKIVLEPRNSVAVPGIGIQRNGWPSGSTRDLPQMVETNTTTSIPSTYHLHGERKGTKGVIMVEYITDYDVITRNLDQAKAKKVNKRRYKKKGDQT